VLLVDQDDVEAARYLGDDYPFRLKLNDPRDLENAIGVLREAFGTSSWVFAMDKVISLRRCTSLRALTAELDGLLALAPESA